MNVSKYTLHHGALAALCAGMLWSGQAASANQCQNLVFSDEFEGSALDTNKWEPQIGDGCNINLCGWGNNELQWYKAENATVANGLLTITAKKERVRASNYTSARLRTANMPQSGEWTHGRFEARIKLPNSPGMWPAFWMLPTDPDVGWPMSGEIDIMESTGQSDMHVSGTIHHGEAWPDNEWTGNSILKQPDRWSDDFHVYAVEWEPHEIRWYVDDLLYSVKRPEDLSSSSYWTFEYYRYHFLLNIAVGGSLGGWVDDSQLPQTMDVDYVRVYDTRQPSITGEHLVSVGETATYSVIDEVGTSSSYTWSVPAGATIVSGAGTRSIEVQWQEGSGGDVVANIDNSCGVQQVVANVYLLPQLARDHVHDDFEANRNLVYTTVTGTFNQAAANPAPDSVNGTATVAEYVRNSQEQWDVLVAGTTAIPDVAPYMSGDRAFYLDVYTATAPVGTEILVQLENSSVATASNYPSGRHSKYVAHTSVQNQWERLKFELQERIDGATGNNDVDSLVVLLNPNSFTSDIYYWDNFDTYGVASSGSNTAPTASFTHTCTDLSCDFDGTASSDSDGSIASYDWDFGDGATGSGSLASHNYSASGSYSVTLTVTDNGGATGSSSSTVSVSAGSSDATTMSVSSVETGTLSASQGQKYATAKVTVLDNTGSPAPNVTVTGDFSGSIVESGASAVTDANGVAEIVSSSTAKGNITVNFCVTSLAQSTLTHDTSSSIGLCP
ncbi:family 16 glycosylhydrolase [Proteobacteria bacterium 005FR1]|nr:family 16 glycosylhydrolase [Proteobacteria bacterium 005FR1]